MTTASPDKTHAPSGPETLINGRWLAPLLLPTFSMGRPAPLLRLHLDHYIGPEGSPLTVRVLELDGYFALDGTLDGIGRKTRIQERGKDAQLARFRVTPRASQRLEGRAGWADPEPLEGALEKAPEGPIPYFRLTFAPVDFPKSAGPQEPDPESPVFYLPIDKAGEEEDGFEIGYEVLDAEGNVLSRSDCNVAKLKLPSCRVPAAPEAAHLCGDFAHGKAMEGWLNDQYAEDGRDAVKTPELRQIEARRQEDMKKAALQAMKDLDRYLETSESTYAAHVRNFRDYQAALRAYLDLLETYNRTSLEDRHMLDGLLALKKQEVEERKRDLDQYLSSSQAVPVHYQEQIEAIRAARKRSEALDAFLDHPVTKVITFLPGMNMIPSVVNIAQGKYLEAFASAGLDLLTAGSFSKLSRMARLFTRTSSKQAGSLTALLSYRYLQASLGKLGKMDNLLQIASRVDPGYVALFDAFKGFKSLVNQGEKMANLLKANPAIQAAKNLVYHPDATSAAAFVNILRKSVHYDNFLLAVEFFELSRKAESAEKKALKLADHLKGGQPKEPNGLAVALMELRSLSAHGHVLPSARLAGNTVQSVIDFLKGLAEKEFSLEKILLEIPEKDVRARVSLERSNSGKLARPTNFQNGRLDGTEKDYREQLAFIRKAFHEVVPLRAEEHLKKGLDCFHLWDAGKCRWDLDLETKVIKMADQLEGRAMLMGLDYPIRSWLDGVRVPDPHRKGKTWIVHPGFSILGMDYCENVIDWIAE